MNERRLELEDIDEDILPEEEAERNEVYQAIIRKRLATCKTTLLSYHLIRNYILTRARVAYKVYVRKHSGQAVYCRLIRYCVLKVELDLLVDICAVERYLLRIVAYYLIADSIRRVSCSLSASVTLRIYKERIIRCVYRSSTVTDTPHCRNRRK